MAAEEDAQQREAQARTVHRDQQAAADDHWRLLLANDPSTALEVLESAFADNEAPAAPIDVQDDHATMLVMAPPLDIVPARKPALTPTGKPTLKKRTKGELQELYTSAVASSVLVTAREEHPCEK